MVTSRFPLVLPFWLAFALVPPCHGLESSVGVALTPAQQPMRRGLAGIHGELIRPELDWSNPALAEFLVANQVAGIRYPGGTAANWYRWQTGVFHPVAGLSEKEQTQLAVFNSNLEPWGGLRKEAVVEWLRRAKVLANEDPLFIVCVSPFTGTPAGMADWLGYFDAQGHTPHGVEIGNEIFGKLAYFTNAALAWREYVTAVSNHRVALRARLPGVPLAVSGVQYFTWNEAELDRAAAGLASGSYTLRLEYTLRSNQHLFEAVATHPYIHPGSSATQGTPEEFLRTVLGGQAKVALKYYRYLTNAYPGKELWYTEFGIFPQVGHFLTTFVPKLYLAAFYLDLIKQPKVRYAHYHNVTSIFQPGYFAEAGMVKSNAMTSTFGRFMECFREGSVCQELALERCPSNCGTAAWPQIDSSTTWYPEWRGAYFRGTGPQGLRRALFVNLGTNTTSLDLRPLAASNADRALATWSCITPSSGALADPSARESSTTNFFMGRVPLPAYSLVCVDWTASPLTRGAPLAAVPGWWEPSLRDEHGSEPLLSAGAVLDLRLDSATGRVPPPSPRRFSAVRWHWYPVSGPTNELTEFIDGPSARCQGLVPTAGPWTIEARWATADGEEGRASLTLRATAGRCYGLSALRLEPVATGMQLSLFPSNATPDAAWRVRIWRNGVERELRRLDGGRLLDEGSIARDTTYEYRVALSYPDEGLAFTNLASGTTGWIDYSAFADPKPPVSTPAETPLPTRMPSTVRRSTPVLSLPLEALTGLGGRLTVTLLAERGGKRQVLWDGLMPVGRPAMQVDFPGRSMEPGVWILELRLQAPGEDASKARVLRRLLFVLP